MRNDNVIEKSVGGNVTYYINEKKRTVVAILNMDGVEFCNSVEKIINKNTAQTRMNCAFDPNMMFTGVVPWYSKPVSFKGISHCSANDVWDVETGKKVAFMKASLRCKKYLFESAVSTVEFLLSVSNDIKEYAYNIASSMNGVKERYSALCKTE